MTSFSYICVGRYNMNLPRNDFKLFNIVVCVTVCLCVYTTTHVYTRIYDDVHPNKKGEIHFFCARLSCELLVCGDFMLFSAYKINLF